MRQDWVIKNLGELCQIKTGKKDVNQGNPNGKYPFFTCAKEHTYSDSFSFDTEALLIAGNGDVGNVSYYKGRFEAYQRTYVLSDFQEVDPWYLYRILDGTLKQAMSFSKLGNTMPYIKLGMLKEFPIPIPPLPEQKRIVAILDEAFAAIDKAKANAEQNLRNAKELFESYLNGVFANPGQEWKEKRLGDICSIGDGNYSSKYPKASEFVPEGIPFLTATNLKNGTVISDGIRFISQEQHLTLTKGHIIKGDLVIVVRGSSTGNNSIVPEEYAGSNLNSQLAFLRVNGNELSSEYLFAVFNCPQVMKTVKSAISGAAQPQLPNNKLLDIKISYPNSQEQNNIVQKLHTLRSQTQNLEAKFLSKISICEELKKSILQKAFSGELTSAKSLVS